MSQKRIIIALSVVILILGSGWYYQTKISNPDESSALKDTEKGVVDALKSGVTPVGTFADILGAGDAQECRFSGTDPTTGEYTEGKIYIDGESFRLEANTTIEGQEGTVNMIQHNRIMYMWSDNEAMMPGIKIDTSMFENMDGAEGMEKPASPIDWLKDPESGADYDCSGWLPNASLFVPPADIEFMDMFGGIGEMFGEVMESGMKEIRAEGEATMEY